jgi:hypothetical protein
LVLIDGNAVVETDQSRGRRHGTEDSPIPADYHLTSVCCGGAA